MTGSRPVAGATGLQLVHGVTLLHPEDQVFEAMLAGWRDQQLARNLGADTVGARDRLIRGFAADLQAHPWQWTLGMADEWFADLRAVRHLARSTVRSYQGTVRTFCDYLTDPAYGWAEECLQRFDSHPIQVIGEVNAAVHVADYEGEPTKRAFTRAELQALFDYADERVAIKRAAGRKGWVTAFRDATILKVAYGYGLRRNETRMLDITDFGPNPHAREFAEYGVCYVRYGKAKKGSPPKRRSVLTVWPWTVDVLRQWFTEVWPLQSTSADDGAAWPSERSQRVGVKTLDSKLAAYRDQLGLDPALDFHSLRRSYVTHLIEDGWDPRFVQEQVGHDHASTTSIYTCVSSDFRTRTLRQVLDQTITDALKPPGGAHR